MCIQIVIVPYGTVISFLDVPIAKLSRMLVNNSNKYKGVISCNSQYPRTGTNFCSRISSYTTKSNTYLEKRTIFVT